MALVSCREPVESRPGSNKMRKDHTKKAYEDPLLCPTFLHRIVDCD